MLTDAKILTVTDLAAYLRVHRATVYRLIKMGKLPAFKVGSDWRFKIEAIDQWRLRLGVEGTGELRSERGN